MYCAWVFAILVAVLLAFAIVLVLNPSLADQIAEALHSGQLNVLPHSAQIRDLE